MTPLLVIGYGNELRGDDGAGPQVARIVEGWNRPDVRAVAVHQLIPELAPLIADAERVVFVDAAVDSDCGWGRLMPSERHVGVGHTSDPEWLLELTAVVYGRVPEAWLATLPASDISYDSKLTPDAERGVQVALCQIEQATNRGG
jgi:hydrogenase maturation protease